MALQTPLERAKYLAERAIEKSKTVRDHPHKSGIEVWGHIGDLAALVETLAACVLALEPGEVGE